MKFYFGNSTAFSNSEKVNVVRLSLDDWDDWFTFSTLFNVYYYDENSVQIRLGSIKIGQMNMTTRSPQLDEEFEQLPEDFFSIGQDVSYYQALNERGEDFRHDFLRALNDMAFDDEIYQKAFDERVTRQSLLRDVSTISVVGQFRRLANGNAELTPYNFKFEAPKISRNSSIMELEFSVIPKSNPPTNIHVIIGRNGVGKTHLFNTMIATITDDATNKIKSGKFTYGSGDNDKFFANLVSVSFSAFDENTILTEKKDKTKNINFSYIGLKKLAKEGEKLPPKSPTVLRNEFVKSVEKCRRGAKNALWINALKMLETDPMFQEAEVTKIASFAEEDDIKEIASEIFTKLSSGHKIVLLTITRLVETIEERSLVLLDEPEGYLHPPLLSAFIRALSDLLVKRNAVAIIGTHSPVVLQEVPRSCVWKLIRQGVVAKAERLQIESFGENVGMLTQEVFGLEVTEAGFHKLLNKAANNSENYEDALAKFNNHIGMEAKAILRNLFL